MSVTLTEKAVKEIKRIMEDQKLAEGTGVRVAVKGGGCSGLSYDFGFDEKIDAAKDEVFEQDGLKVIVDKKSSLFLDGTSVDFYEGLDKRGFVFENPNATGKGCGCGKSFQV